METVIMDGMTVAQYAAHVGKTERTVRSWLNDGELPGAERNDRGVWTIPASAVRQPRPLALVRAEKAAEAATAVDVLAQLPAFVPVDRAAALLGISEYAVRQHADALGGVYWGDNGALVIPQRMIRQLFGIGA